MKIFTIILAMIFMSCSSSDEAKETLSLAGYTQIKTTGYSVFGCGEDDKFRTGFVAISPNGRKVEGVVCSGFFKGATIRIKGEVK